MTYSIKKIDSQALYQSIWREHGLHILQSWNWGELKQLEGWKVLRLGLFTAENAEKPLAVISLQQKPLPFVGSTLAYIAKLSSSLWLSSDVLPQLKSFLQTEGIAFAVLEFDRGMEPPDTKLFSLYPGHIQPPQTDQVSLGKSEEELLQGLDSKYRRNMRKAEREGVRVEMLQYSDEALDPLSSFYEVMQSIFKSTKFMERDRKYFESLWRLLSQDGLARIFLAKVNLEGQEQTVGAYLTVLDNKGAYELYGGVNRLGRDLEAGYLLKWEAIRYYNNQGLQYYDHWGVAPKSPEGEYEPAHELYHISRFKAGFGGEYVRFPAARALVIDSMKYSLFSAGLRFNRYKVKLQKLLKR